MAAVGGHLGGGVVSEFAGYQIGKSIEHALENLGGVARENFLANLQKTNPEAFARAKQFISTEDAAKATRLQLPPGSPKGTPENPHAMGPQTGMSPGPQGVLPAKKNPVSVNPKSGKFQTTYSTEVAVPKKK